MKYVSLAENLKPDNTIDGDDLTRGTAKHLFEQDAKEFEARAARSWETLLAAKRRGKQVKEEKLVVRQNVGDKTVTVGPEEKIYTNNMDCGLFASIITAYNKHWKLRTSPEDCGLFWRDVSSLPSIRTRKEAVQGPTVIVSHCCGVPVICL